MANPDVFLSVAPGILNRAPGLNCCAERHRKFRALFRITPATYANTWLEKYRSQGASYKHLLWACMLLKVYGNVMVFTVLAGVDRKTWRKWFLEFVGLIAGLKVVITFDLYFCISVYLLIKSDFLEKIDFCNRYLSMIGDLSVTQALTVPIFLFESQHNSILPGCLIISGAHD